MLLNIKQNNVTMFLYLLFKLLFAFLFYEVSSEFLFMQLSNNYLILTFNVKNFATYIQVDPNFDVKIFKRL